MLADSECFLAVRAFYTEAAESIVSKVIVEEASPTTRYLYDWLKAERPERYNRFLLSPDTHFHLVRPYRSARLANIKFCERSLFAEQYLFKSGAPTDEHGRVPLWTATGDYEIQLHQFAVESHGVWVGETLIDGTSALHRFDHKAEDALIPNYSRAELTEIYRTVAAAILSIQHGHRCAHELFVSFVRVVVLQRIEAGRQFVSGSQSSLIGKVALANIHTTSLAGVIDALVHEATHSLLYVLEFYEPFFGISRSNKLNTIVSPWTGRELHPHSYLHACFVWYTLSSFWTKMHQVDTDNHYLSRALGGFIKEGDLEAPLVGLVSESTCAMIADLQRRIKGLLTQQETMDLTGQELFADHR